MSNNEARRQWDAWQDIKEAIDDSIAMFGDAVDLESSDAREETLEALANARVEDTFIGRFGGDQWRVRLVPEHPDYEECSCGGEILCRGDLARVCQECGSVVL